MSHSPGRGRSSYPDVHALLHGCTAECCCSIASSRAKRNGLLAMASLLLVGPSKLYTIRAEFVNLDVHCGAQLFWFVYKPHEIRGLRPRRRLPDRKTHALLK